MNLWEYVDKNPHFGVPLLILLVVLISQGIGVFKDVGIAVAYAWGAARVQKSENTEQKHK